MINSTPSFDFELTDGQFEKRSEKIKAAPPVELGLVGNFTPEQFEEISAKLKLAHIFFERMEWLNATACYNYLVSDVEGGFAPSAYGRLALTGTKDPKIDPSDIVRLANKSMRAQPKEASAYLAIAILACRIDNAYYASRWIQLAELAGGMPESIMDLVKSDIKYAIESAAIRLEKCLKFMMQPSFFSRLEEYFKRTNNKSTLVPILKLIMPRLLADASLIPRYACDKHISSTVQLLLDEPPLCQLDITDEDSNLDSPLLKLGDKVLDNLLSYLNLSDLNALMFTCKRLWNKGMLCLGNDHEENPQFASNPTLRERKNYRGLRLLWTALENHLYSLKSSTSEPSPVMKSLWYRYVDPCELMFRGASYGSMLGQCCNWLAQSTLELVKRDRQKLHFFKYAMTTTIFQGMATLLHVPPLDFDSESRDAIFELLSIVWTCNCPDFSFIIDYLQQAGLGTTLRSLAYGSIFATYACRYLHVLFEHHQHIDFKHVCYEPKQELPTDGRTRLWHLELQQSNLPGAFPLTKQRAIFKVTRAVSESKPESSTSSPGDDDDLDDEFPDVFPTAEAIEGEGWHQYYGRVRLVGTMFNLRLIALDWPTKGANREFWVRIQTWALDQRFCRLYNLWNSTEPQHFGYIWRDTREYTDALWTAEVEALQKQTESLVYRRATKPEMNPGLTPGSVLPTVLYEFIVMTDQIRVLMQNSTVHFNTIHEKALQADQLLTLLNVHSHIPQLGRIPDNISPFETQTQFQLRVRTAHVVNSVRHLLATLLLICYAPEIQKWCKEDSSQPLPQEDAHSMASLINNTLCTSLYYRDTVIGEDYLGVMEAFLPKLLTFPSSKVIELHNTFTEWASSTEAEHYYRFQNRYNSNSSSNNTATTTTSTSSTSSTNNNNNHNANDVKLNLRQMVKKSEKKTRRDGSVGTVLLLTAAVAMVAVASLGAFFAGRWMRGSDQGDEEVNE